MEKEKNIQVSAQQLIQMARQEEYELSNKKKVLEKVSGLLFETITTKETLKEIKKTPGKIMIGIGATVLIETNITNKETCKRALGENSYKEENIEETVKWLEKKEEQIKKQAETMQKEVAASSTRLTEITGILKQLETQKRKMAQKAVPTLSK